jgi:hypothetical protein
MGAGIQRWWRNPDRLQHECDAFDGKEPQLADHVKWFRDHQFDWALHPLVPEPQWDPPKPFDVSDAMEARIRMYVYRCNVCDAFFADPHWHHGIFNIE